jgi:hypothetical protein
MFNTLLGPGAIGAGAALRYGFDQMMRLLEALAPQHLLQHMLTFFTSPLIEIFSDSDLL